MSDLPVLGWKEVAILPEWGIDKLRVKLDTGAKTSALHVENLSTQQHGEHVGRGLPIATFDIPLTRLDDGPRVTVQTPVIGYRSVRDTRARPERRPVVRTRLRCGAIDAVVEVTLTDRSGMLFRMILGRRALKGRVLVDSSRVFTTRRAHADSPDGQRPLKPRAEGV